ncbi:MAG TPA: DUF4410 domain-containing protein [Verrucomicrobiota bacterium]|nr:DUF4410 domain-containing protein [Verrucomicrobiota bacterium]
MKGDITMKKQVNSNMPRCLVQLGLCVFSLLMVVGCASTKVSNQSETPIGVLPRPGHIWVYDFVATASDVPSDAALAGAGDVDTTSQTPEQIAEGRKLGSEIAAQLINDIQAMGMPAAHAWTGTTPAVNDLVIRGYLLSVKEGSAAKRFMVGFGSGASELKTVVEGFRMTATGLQKVGGGTVDASGSKSPGAALGVAGLLATHNPAGLIISSGMKIYGEKSGKSTVEGRAKATSKEIADHLKIRFQEQGWIPAD